MTAPPAATSDGGRPGWAETCRGAGRAALAAARGRLPAHYDLAWRAPFDIRVAARLRSNMQVLDMGSGWAPSVAPGQRPPGCRYVGMDVSRAELDRAPEGSYDEVAVADIRRSLPELRDRFDLVVSCQVLEHVKPITLAADTVGSYLRPGGRFVAFFSGRYSVYGILNRLLPPRASRWAMKTFLDRPADTMFRAYYDQCWAAALHRLFGAWSELEVVPFWHGAGYFAFSRPLQSAYIGYEEWARRSGRVNLAPYYLIDVRR